MQRSQRGGSLIVRVRQQTELLALEQARRVPWGRLAEAAEEYTDWQVFTLWLRAVVEAAGNILSTELWHKGWALARGIMLSSCPNDGGNSEAIAGCQVNSLSAGNLRVYLERELGEVFLEPTSAGIPESAVRC